LQFTLCVAASAVETSKNMAATVAIKFNEVLNAVMRHPPRLSIIFVRLFSFSAAKDILFSRFSALH